MHIGCIRRECQFFVRGQTVESARFAAQQHFYRPFATRFGHDFTAPVTGIQIFCRMLLTAQQRHRHHRKLLRCATLQEQDMEIFRQAEQGADVVFGFLHNGGKPV
ncbi:hypothetical protein SRABI106_04428 [Rahnella aquatilis]|nr:hypothetical protein SRABI106_04428 [Rahnella aquatilis]